MAKQRTTAHGTDPQAAAEASVFRAAVRDVTPLVQTPPAAGLAKPQPRARRRKPASPAIEDAARPMSRAAPLQAHGSAADTLPAAGEAIAGGDALSFQRAGVRIQVMRRLRRGLYPVEDELDLHGLSQAEARYRLTEFIEISRDAGRRCVRIIHGKGYRSGARGPVLKTAVNLWLRHHLDVMAFASARAIDGGTGALYVLLRA
jgi:DNA-nicking Smr family endonuclease